METTTREKQKSIKSLQTLQNIGPATAERLYSIGVKTPEQMRRSDPGEIYEKLREKEGGKLDKCALYLLQGAVLDIPWPRCKNLTEGRT
jgi:hypothetical protein